MGGEQAWSRECPKKPGQFETGVENAVPSSALRPPLRASGAPHTHCLSVPTSESFLGPGACPECPVTGALLCVRAPQMLGCCACRIPLPPHPHTPLQGTQASPTSELRALRTIPGGPLVTCPYLSPSLISPSVSWSVLGQCVVGPWWLHHAQSVRVHVGAR